MTFPLISAYRIFQELLQVAPDILPVQGVFDNCLQVVQWIAGSQPFSLVHLFGQKDPTTFNILSDCIDDPELVVFTERKLSQDIDDILIQDHPSEIRQLRRGLIDGWFFYNVFYLHGVGT